MLPVPGDPDTITFPEGWRVRDGQQYDFNGEEVDEASITPFVVDEITLVGSRCGPFAPALAALARGDVDPRPLVEARYPLAEAVAAFDHAARPGALKILVDC